MLIAKLNGQKLTVVSDAVVSDSVKYLTVRFEYSREWDGFSKTAIFFGNDGSTYSVPMLEGNSMYIGENTCYVPYEVIKTPSFEISVFGTSGERVITSDKAMVGVRESGYCEGETPAAPTPNEYSQLMDAANYALEEAELAKQIASDNSSDFQNQFDSKMDKFAETTETETERKIVLDEFSGKEGDTNAVIFESKGGHSQLKLTDGGEAYFKVAGCIIKKEITGGNFWDLDNCGFRNVAAPEEENDAANKEYVDTIAKNTRDFIIPEKISDDLAGVLYLGNNKEYVPTNEVIAVQFDFPSGDFICSLYFTTAAEGNINITFPEGTKFIGAKPTFGNGETWELNIKNGVVVGGKVV